MRKSYRNIKSASDSDISMTFYLMVMAMNEKDTKTVMAWYRDLLSESNFAYRVELLSEDERTQIDSACDSVFKKYNSEI